MNIKSILTSALLLASFMTAGAQTRYLNVKIADGQYKSFEVTPDLKVTWDRQKKDFMPEYVDLGLSVNWASCNLGADNPWDSGDYFAWGETVGDPSIEGKTEEYEKDFCWQTYCGHTTFTEWATPPFAKNEQRYETLLKPEYDAVVYNWGGAWRMPTTKELQELIDNCTCVWVENYNETGVAGTIVTSRKEGYTDKSIFLPASGNRNRRTLDAVNFYGNYWTAEIDYFGLDNKLAFIMEVNNQFGLCGNTLSERYRGLTIRPVCPKE